jgi:hypothetical protein
VRSTHNGTRCGGVAPHTQQHAARRRGEFPRVRGTRVRPRVRTRGAQRGMRAEHGSGVFVRGNKVWWRRTRGVVVCGGGGGGRSAARARAS